MKRTISGIVVSKLVVGAALVGILGWSSLTNAKLPAQAAVQVKIDNFSFIPQEITVTAGTKVTWVNQDDIPHTVRSTSDAFKSKALDTDDKYSFTFDKPGTYEYYCSIHPKMTAKVIVK
ncbi:MAG: cupredoxin family copper-binding protein [Candidatus Acidiferrales bacterium]